MGKRRWMHYVVCGTLAAVGIGMALYPLLSNYYSDRHQSTVYTEYGEAIKQTDESTIEEARAAAQAYNDALKQGGGLPAGYEDILNLTDNGIMGYIEIPCLSLRLPIRHGVAPATMEIGAGHLEGSSLPVGGDGTHAVITAHSGMPGQKMFSDLDTLEIGDLFYLEVLGTQHAYQVDQVLVVLPGETDALSPERGKDLCTLVTCTPFGVNTHRLLVRGSRVPYEENTANGNEKPSGTKKHSSTWERQYFLWSICGLAVSAVCAGLAWAVFSFRRKHRRRRDNLLK